MRSPAAGVTRTPSTVVKLRPLMARRRARYSAADSPLAEVTRMVTTSERVVARRRTSTPPP